MKRPPLLVLALAFAAACGGARTEGGPDKGYTISGSDPYRFLVDPDVLRQWGGPGSAKFNRMLEEELARRGFCRNGYALRNEGSRDGLYSVTVLCRS
jgi:hypothetical protein